MNAVTERTAEFDAWIADNYHILKEQISLAGAFDDDVFHDTYLAVLCGLTSDIGQTYYERVFNATYRELWKNKLSASMRTVNPSDIFFALLSDTQDEVEPTTELEQGVTAKEVIQYAQRSLSPTDWKLFNLRFINSLPFSQIGVYIGIDAPGAFRKCDRIIAGIRSHFSTTNPLTAVI